jgi:hypothetical protein
MPLKKKSIIVSDPCPLENLCKEVSYRVIQPRQYPNKFRAIHRWMLNSVEFCSRKPILQKSSIIASKSKQMNKLKKSLSNSSTVTHLDHGMVETLTVLNISRINFKGLSYDLVAKIKKLDSKLY